MMPLVLNHAVKIIIVNVWDVGFVAWKKFLESGNHTLMESRDDLFRICRWVNWFLNGLINSSGERLPSSGILELGHPALSSLCICTCLIHAVDLVCHVNAFHRANYRYMMSSIDWQELSMFKVSWCFGLSITSMQSHYHKVDFGGD